MIPFISGGDSLPVTSFSFSSIQPSTLNQVTLVLKIDFGKTVTIDWGDGNGEQSVTCDGHDQTLTSNYVTNNTTYTITIAGNLGYLRKFQIGTEATVSNLNLNDFASNGVGLTQLILGQLGSGVTGSIANLPSTVYNLDIQCSGTTISGAPVNAPSGITFMRFVSISTLSGAMPTASSHADMFWFYILTCVGVNGSISTVPPLIRYWFTQSTGTLTGSFNSLFSNCQALTNFWMQFVGSSLTATSDAQPSSTLRSFTLLPAAPTLSACAFDISKFSAVGGIFMQNLSGCTGNIESLTGSISTLTLRDIGSGVIYNGGALQTFTFAITFRTGWNTAMVDAFLNAYALVAVSGAFTIDLRSPNQARSSASDAAVATLQGLGRTVLTA